MIETYANSSDQLDIQVFKPNLFENKTVVITGGGTGLGRATATMFYQLGANVVIAGRRTEPLQETKGSLGDDRCFDVVTNIRDIESVENLREKTMERFGAVHFVINNAGGQYPAKPSEISDNGWRAVVDLNLNGTWNMVNRFMEPLIAQQFGSIINVVHIFSFDRGAPAFVHSGAARAGVVNMTKSMAPYLGKHGVTINAVAPGTIKTTGFTENEMKPLGYDDDSFKKQVEDHAPLGRIGSAEEIAGIFCFLCSPLARIINGASIVADGGELLSNWADFWPKGEW